MDDVVRMNRLSPALLESVKYTLFFFFLEGTYSSVCYLLIFLIFSNLCSQAFTHHHKVRNSFFYLKLKLWLSLQPRNWSLSYEAFYIRNCSHWEHYISLRWFIFVQLLAPSPGVISTRNFSVIIMKTVNVYF